MKLSKKQIKQLIETPLIKTRIKRVDKYIIHETIITTIKPADYYKAVIGE